MKKIWLIIKREYLSRVRKRSFIITTLLAPLGLILLFAIQFLFIGMGKEKAVIAISDQSQLFTQDLRLQDSERQNIFFKIENSFSYEELKEKYTDLGYAGILYIPEMQAEKPKTSIYHSAELLGMGRKNYIERQMANIIKNQRIKTQGIDKDFIKSLSNINVSIKEEVEGKETDDVSSALASAVGGFMGFIMYLVIIIYGTLVMRGVMEEKTNRIVEVILSSVRPFQLLAGKIIGIGFVGLTQFLIWIVLGIGINFLASLFLAGSVDISSANELATSGPDSEEITLMVQDIMNKVYALPIKSILFSFLFFFFTGYLLYAALFAAVGSAVGEDSSESQALVFPVTLPIIISFFILTAILENPNSSLAFWSSIVPFSSPIIMPARIAYGLSIFSLDFFLAVVFMIAGLCGIIWLAGKIYRTGILMTGKKASFKELGKWLFQ